MMFERRTEHEEDHYTFYCIDLFGKLRPYGG